MILNWFASFATDLLFRSRRRDFPAANTEAGSVFWEEMESSLDRLNATEMEADAASRVVCEDAALWPNQYRVALLAEIRRVRAAASSTTPAASTEDDAWRASRACPDCGGSGLAIRYIHASIVGVLKTPLGNDVQVGYSLAMPCSCPLGHATLVNLGLINGKLRLRVDQSPLFCREPQPWAETSDGLDNRFRHRAADWSEDHARPYAIENAARTPKDLRNLITTLKAPSLPETATASRQWAARTARPAEPRHEPPRSLPEEPARTLQQPPAPRAKARAAPITYAPAIEPVAARNAWDEF